MFVKQSMKENTKIRIGALIAAILLAGLCLAFGQTASTYTCYTERGDVDTVHLSKSGEILFVDQKTRTDSIKLWIEVIKTLSDGEKLFYIKVKYPNTIKASRNNSLLINVKDIGIVEFQECAYIQKDNLCVYKLIDSEVMSLSIRGYDMISFNSNNYTRPVTYAIPQRHFVDFFVNYYK